MNDQTSVPLRGARLAWAVLDKIKSLPADAPVRWNQRVDRREEECGWSMCFGGWACELAGARFHRCGRGVNKSYAAIMDARQSEDGEKYKAGYPYSINDLARRLLGLPYAQYYEGRRNDPFHAANTLTDLERIVEERFGPRPDVAAAV
jgi:hypothetical protein